MLIYVACSSRLKDREVAAVKRGAEDFGKLVGCDIRFLGTKKWEEGKIHSADEFLAKGKLRNNAKTGYKQLDTQSMSNMIANEVGTWKKKGTFVLVTDDDLYFPGIDWCFGSAYRGMVVMSVARFRMNNVDSKTADLCIRRTVNHELGHVYKAVRSNRKTAVEKHGMHCTNKLCTMCRTSNTAELKRVAIAENGEPHFCAECEKSMKDYVKSQKPKTTTSTPAKQSATNTRKGPAINAKNSTVRKDSATSAKKSTVRKGPVVGAPGSKTRAVKTV